MAAAVLQGEVAASIYFLSPFWLPRNGYNYKVKVETSLRADCLTFGCVYPHVFCFVSVLVVLAVVE